jgi:hypothetical protein
MLFPYQYVTHKMEKMQVFIDFIFINVWCNAPSSGTFSLDLFNGNADLKEVMTIFNYGDTEGGDFFYSHVQSIYDHFATLTTAQIDQLKHWYIANNDIEKVCANDPAIHIARYVDISAIHLILSGQLATFFKGLYSKKLLDLSALRDKIGDIDDHYLHFMQTNTIGKCPFCGMSDLQGEYNTTREAYDHYLPKKLYPFNSINFHNLVPACHHCNSSYKTSKDPAYPPKDPVQAIQRRKVFYPYASTPYTIEFQVNLHHADIQKMAPEDIELQFGPTAISEEIDTWKYVYGIDERYKAKILSESDGKYWLTQVFDEWSEDGKSPKEYLRTLTRQANDNRFAECNFLKLAFLNGCNRAGIFPKSIWQRFYDYFISIFKSPA